MRKFTYSSVHRCVRYESKLLCVLLDSTMCSARFNHHSAPSAASRFSLRAALSLFKAGLRAVARPFRKTLAFGSFEGLLETWVSFCARSRRYTRAVFLQHVICRGIWVQARHLRPRASTQWQSYARLKPSTDISGDVTHTFANMRFSAL